MPEIIRCGICQRFFKPGHGLQKYCPKCRGTKKYRKSEPIRYIKCAQCGMDIETPRSVQRFCSDNCRAAWHSNKVLTKKKCAECGNVFHSTKDHQIYCSRTCRYKVKLRRAHADYLRRKQ